jgi:hypothetical protein
MLCYTGNGLTHLTFTLCLSLQYGTFELRALHLLGKHSIISATPTTLFALVIFQIWSLAFCLNWTQKTLILLPIYASCVAWITDVNHT